MTRKPLLSALAITSGALALLLSAHHARSVLGPVLAADNANTGASAGWNRQAAASYLDSREVWWQSWDHAQKDHGTVCVSCHTQATYGLARPALRNDLDEQSPTAPEQVMLASIQKRVRMWNEVLPFYSDAVYGDGKTVESRDAESVLNAFILLSYNSRRLDDTTRMALDNAWALQTKSGPDAGAWVWQNFDYTPWESKESQYHWAALMAEAVANAPDNYRSDPKITGNLSALRAYLTSHYEAQPLLNKVVVLWASAQFPGLLTPAQRTKLLEDTLWMPARGRRLEPGGPGHVAEARPHAARKQARRLRDGHHRPRPRTKPRNQPRCAARRSMAHRQPGQDHWSMAGLVTEQESRSQFKCR